MRFVVVAAVAALGLLASPAGAADFSKKLLDGEGELLCRGGPGLAPIPEGTPCPEARTLTLGRVAREALAGTYQDEPNLSTEDKVKRGDLSQRLVGASEVKLEIDDAALLKKLITKAWPTIVVWAAMKELNAPSK